MRRSAWLIAAALLLAGCGASTSSGDLRATLQDGSPTVATQQLVQRGIADLLDAPGLGQIPVSAGELAAMGFDVEALARAVCEDGADYERAIESIEQYTASRSILDDEGRERGYTVQRAVEALHAALGEARG